MGMPLPQLQALLLDIFSTRRPVEEGTVAALSAKDWDVLLGMARQHRLLPMLHWRLTKERTDLSIPPAVSERLTSGFKRSGMRALRMQRELLLIQQILDRAGIQCIDLKGAYLAFHAYPQPALRPMRDLDILVPEERALSAYQAMLDSGFIRLKKYQGDPEAVMRTRNHLPPLHSPSARVNVEIHTRISDPRDGHSDPVDDPFLWQRTICRVVGGTELNYLCPTDQLHHLIEHAVYHHRLDNGPLVLSDLAYLLETHPIDWPFFWRRADEFGQKRGAILMLKMVERYFGKQPVDWCSVDQGMNGVEAMIESASLLSLRDFSSKDDFNLDVDVLSRSSTRARIRFYFQKAFPSKKEMATIYPAIEHSPRIYFWYLIRWWRVLTLYLPAYLARKKADQMGFEVRHVIQLEHWLKGTTGEAGSASSSNN